MISIERFDKLPAPPKIFLFPRVCYLIHVNTGHTYFKKAFQPCPSASSQG